MAGFFSNAARLTPDGRYTTVRDNRRVAVDPSSVLQKFGQVRYARFDVAFLWLYAHASLLWVCLSSHAMLSDSIRMVPESFRSHFLFASRT